MEPEKLTAERGESIRLPGGVHAMPSSVWVSVYHVYPGEKTPLAPEAFSSWKCTQRRTEDFINKLPGSRPLGPVGRNQGSFQRCETRHDVIPGLERCLQRPFYVLNDL